MKKFIVPVLSICFFISCNSDDNSVSDNIVEYRSRAFIPKTTAVNAANEYDYVGKYHADMLDEYLSSYDTINVLQDVIDDVDNIAGNNQSYLNITGTYVPLSVIQVQWTLDNSDLPEDIINNTAMSSLGKSLMGNFVDMLDDLKLQPYNQARKNIMGFENSIINNELLTEADNQAILGATSITRFSIQETYPRKRSWSSTKSGIVASIAASSPGEAVTLSVAVNMATE